MKHLIFSLILLLGVGFVTADWVVPSAPAGGVSLWTQTGSDIYYNSGDVGVLETNPLAPLHISSISEDTEIRADSPIGVFDSSYTWYNSGIKEYEFSMCDSTSDELKLIRGANSICTGKDTFTITQSGLEMGTAMLYYDAPTRWYRTPCCSASGNNFFELDDTLGTLPDIETVSAGQQGQIAYVICSDTTSIMKDQAVGGNLQLDGDFDCAVEGVGATLTMVYFDNALHSWDWHELGRVNA